MNLKKMVKNIAAVSLIEIMMIFAIIGIVTAASVGLSRPKANYIRNIKLYSALVTLERAGKAIAQEGHIDFTTDIGTCTTRSGNICTDYSTHLGNMNNQLPKVSHRAASSNSELDSGLNQTTYSGLNNNIDKAQYKYLQDGLCQRLASVLKLSSANTNCSNNTGDENGLINDSSAYTQTFSGKTPQLYLNNGQVVYIGKNLYTDYRINASGAPTRKVVLATAPDADAKNLESTAMAGNLNNISSNFTLANFPNSDYAKLPNETRMALVNRTIVHSIAGEGFINYYSQMYKTNKDYFIIYVDTDCKKANDNDKKCGSDRLNDDVFAFRMYRDGTVLPDYNSGFPINFLTAKLYVRNESTGRYVLDTNNIRLPYVHAKCYANLTGSYATGYPNDYIGICTQNNITRMPLAGCYSNLSEPQCKVILNKPSFIMR